MSRRPDRETTGNGLSETVSVILMTILVIAVAAVIASIVFGLVILFPKSAYIVVQTEAKNVSPSNWYLGVSHLNGDNAYLNNTSVREGMPVDFQFTTPGGVLVIPRPVPAGSQMTWNPGDIMYVYNQSGILSVTKDEALARGGTGLPIGVWRFDVVDRTDNVLIYSINTGVGVPNPTPTATVTASTSVTTTATTTIPTTNATTSPTTTSTTTIPTTNVTTIATTTVTATPTPSCGTISGFGLANWEIDIYTRHAASDSWTYLATTVSNSGGFYAFSGLTYHPDQFYELRERSPATGIIDTRLNNGADCFQINMNF